MILDVVYNHTAEGDDEGPTLSFRGLDNETYYMLEADRARYANYTGTGNTLNANESVVRRMILDSLRYWVARCTSTAFASISRPSCRATIGPPAPAPAHPLGHPVGSRPGRNQTDRRGVGRRRPLPGRQLQRRHLAGVER